MELYFGTLLFIFGLCCGSFINMLVYRTAVRYKLRKSIKSNDESRSFCDFCGQQLHWFENVPVASWIIQKGKSRCCGKKLPSEYPIVEAIVGILFLSMFVVLGISWQTVIGMLIITMLVFSAVFDLKYMILPDFSTFIVIGVALMFGWQNWLVGLIAAAFLLLLNVITKGKGMGMGDVKLALFMGLFLGWPKIMVAMYAAFIFGAVVGVWLIIKGKLKRKSLIPFGPFLIGGTFLAWFYGESILKIFNF